MVKKILLILLTVVLMTACFTMTACKKNVYTITFDTDGGTLVKQQKVEDGAKATKPDDPTKVGFEFDDWYLGDEETPFDFETTSINKNLTLKAKWKINQYSIIFNSDGGSAVQTITKDYGTAVNAPTNPTKTGHEFLGWFEDGDDTPYEFSTIEARDVTLKAKWHINQYSITFDTDEGEPATIDAITQDYGTTVVAPTDPTKTGYTFDGWYEEGSETAYEFSTIEARDVTLKAKWHINQYSITFDTDKGEPATIDAITQDYGTTVVAPTAPTKTGHEFLGWFKDGANSPYEFSTIEARDVTLKAKWKINQYSITFDTDEGEPATIDAITQDYGTTVVAPTEPTKPGFNFLGWFEENQVNAYVFSTIEARDVSLTAKWGEREQYSIIFDSDGGSSVATIIEKAGMPISAPTEPTKTGYSFVGWFKDGSNSAYVFNTIEEGNVLLKAKWTINQYSIIFDTDGGSAVQTITKDYGAAVTAPTDPIKDGCVFLGWFEDGANLPYEFSTIEARNVTLKAKWAEIRGVITLDKGLSGEQVNDGNNIFTQSTLTPYVGQEVILPELACFGYKFLGWKNLTTNQMLEKIDGEYKIIHDGNDVKYQAQWEKIYQGSDTV